MSEKISLDSSDNSSEITKQIETHVVSSSVYKLYIKFKSECI